MTTKLNRLAAAGCAILIASAGIATSGNAQTLSDVTKEKLKENLKNQTGGDCAIGMEAGELMDTGQSNLVYYMCSFTQIPGCKKGSTCPPIKCREGFGSSDWNEVSLGSPDINTRPIVIAQSYACWGKG